MALIRIRNFCKSFGNKVVHRDVSLQVRQGECVGLIGGSGTGKSVLLRSLIGLEKPDRGEILIEGHDITKMNALELTELRKKVAYAFQGGALFDSMSVYDNLAYPLREHTSFTEDFIEEKITSILEEFGLEGNESLYPADLSGGMQKRLGLARAIILEPQVVLYDEPTAGLDPFNTRKIREMILDLKRKGITSILVTHDMPVAYAVCDFIALLANGEIAIEGKPEDLKKDPTNTISQFTQGEILAPRSPKQTTITGDVK